MRFWLYGFFICLIVVVQACESTEKSEICPNIYSPVCGCDGITYINQCLAENAGTTKCFAGTCPITDSALVLFTGLSDTLCRYAIEIRKIKYPTRNLPLTEQKDSNRIYLTYTKDSAFVSRCFGDSTLILNVKRIIK